MIEISKFSIVSPGFYPFNIFLREMKLWVETLTIILEDKVSIALYRYYNRLGETNDSLMAV